MAVLTTAAFFSKWTNRFADNSTREIDEADMREFMEDIKDSFQSITGATAITSWKDPCVVATTTNITLSGEQTIDGVLTSASRVLVKDQATSSQNGIYVSASGAWSRATDADATAELEGAAVGVTQGTVNKNSVWVQTTDNVTLGTSAIAWQQIGFGAVNVLNEDDMASDSDTEPPSQSSVKAFVEAQVSSGTINDTDLKYFEQWDWIGSSFVNAACAMGWVPTHSGALAALSYPSFGVTSAEHALGVIEIITGTATNGRTAIWKPGVAFGSGFAYKLRMRIALATLSDGTDTFTLYFGFGDNGSVSGDMVDGAYFRYTHSVNSGKFEAVIADGSTRTATDTGVTTVTTTYSIFEIHVDEAGTEAKFYIDGTLVATLSGTNIPDITDPTGFLFKIEKSAGTSSRSAYMDWYDFLATRSTPR